jgi:predicted molibdopterin-dependent oxidoreductase YjgC
MPEEHPLSVSPAIAARHGLTTGDRVRVRNRETGQDLEMRVAVNDRLVGDLVYVPFNKDRLQARGERYLNRITSQTGRCPYTQQTSLKATEVSLERIEAP